MVFLRRRGEWEARRQRRCTAPVLVRIKGERSGFRRVEDIAAGGFRAVTPLDLEEGQCLPVRLRFPDLWEEVEVDATVAWSSHSGHAGFELAPADNEEARLIGVLIAHQEVLGRLAA